MSFKLLKKQSEDKNRIDNLVKALEDKKKRKDETFWDLTKDNEGNGSAVIRFLPTSKGDSDKIIPVVTIFYHAFRGKGGFYYENCRSTIYPYEDDPVCVYNSKLYNSGDEVLKKWVSENSKRKKHIIANILVVNDPANPSNNGKVFKFRMGQRVYEKIEAAMKGNPTLKKKGFEPWDYWKGADFTYISKVVDRQMNYQDSYFESPSVIHYIDGEPLTEDLIENEIYNKQYSLDAEIDPSKFKSFDVLKARLDKCLGLDTSVDNDTKTKESSVVEKKSSVTKAVTKKEESVEDEEYAEFTEVADSSETTDSLDSDVDAIFRDLEIDIG